MSDEELQEMLDNGKSVPGNPGYKELYRILENTENDILPAGFAHRVTARIEKSESRDPVRKWVIGLISLLVVVATGLVALVISTRPELRVPGSGQVNLYVIFALTLLALALYHFIERKRRRDPFAGN